MKKKESLEKRKYMCIDCHACRQLLLQADSDAVIYENEPMSRHTSFRIGGPADLFVLPGSLSGLIKGIEACRENAFPFCVLGRGSNLLISDTGLRGVVFCTSSLTDVTVEGEFLAAQAGASLAAIAQKAAEHSLEGLAFAAGIPGSLGGGICMNAGAYGGELGELTHSVLLLTAKGELLDIPGEEMDFSYRHSRVLPAGEIVLSAIFSLKKGDRAAILAHMQELAVRRKEKQPLEYPSAGSTFKRPAGHFAGKLIQDAGLAGFSVGDACVSEKHCGFVINKGQASAADVYRLCHAVRACVWDKYKVELEPEIRLLGDFSTVRCSTDL